jgi:hypothetical protein
VQLVRKNIVLWHCQSSPSVGSTTGCGFANAAQNNAAAQASEAIEIAKTLCSPHALVIGGTPDHARSIGPAFGIACEALHNSKAGFLSPDRHFHGKSPGRARGSQPSFFVIARLTNADNE